MLTVTEINAVVSVSSDICINNLQLPNITFYMALILKIYPKIHLKFWKAKVVLSCARIYNNEKSKTFYYIIAVQLDKLPKDGLKE